MQRSYEEPLFQKIATTLLHVLQFVLTLITEREDYPDAYVLLGKFFPFQLSQFKSGSETSEFYSDKPKHHLHYIFTHLAIEPYNTYDSGFYIRLLLVAALTESQFLEQLKKRLDHHNSYTLPQVKGMLKTVRTVCYCILICFCILFTPSIRLHYSDLSLIPYL